MLFVAAGTPLGAWGGLEGAGTVLSPRVNLRTGPALKYPAVAMLGKGQRVNVIGRATGWYRVTAHETGWVAEDYLRLELDGHLPADARAARVSTLAQDLLGRPYAYGRAGPDSFDCSGFTFYVYSQVGIGLPRTAQAQIQTGVRLKRAELEPGDLVFFCTNGRGVSHVGIYLYGGEFIHASSGCGRVTTSTMNQGYYCRNFAGAARVIGDENDRRRGFQWKVAK